MTLRRYLSARGENQSEFSRYSGVAQRTVNRICWGSTCTIGIALTIINASRRRPTPDGRSVTLKGMVAATRAA